MKLLTKKKVKINSLEIIHDSTTTVTCDRKLEILSKKKMDTLIVTVNISRQNYKAKIQLKINRLSIINKYKGWDR